MITKGKNNEIQEGRIIGLNGGIYQIRSFDSLHNGKASARGIFRFHKESQKPMVGDEVAFCPSEDEDIPYHIVSVKPRKTKLERPALANPSAMLIVASLKSPSPDFLLIDKLLVIAEKYKLQASILFTKADLFFSSLEREDGQTREDEQTKIIEEIKNYHKLGFDVLVSETQKETEKIDILPQLEKENLSEFYWEHSWAKYQKKWQDGIVILVGNSGVGKSSFANKLLGQDISMTGEISTKLERGKNTTRNISMYPCQLKEGKLKFLAAKDQEKEDFYLVDSPGFSKLELYDFNCTEIDIEKAYPEIEETAHNCRFIDCKHLAELGCAVLNSSHILKSRYKRYAFLRKELADKLSLDTRRSRYGKTRKDYQKKQDRKLILAPSLLAADFANLREELNKIENHCEYLHIDVMDGHFVPNLSFGEPIIKAIRKHTKLVFDCHLMVTNPSAYYETYAAAGANHISFHIETEPHAMRSIQKIRDLGMTVGVALNPSSPISLLEEILRN